MLSSASNEIASKKRNAGEGLVNIFQSQLYSGPETKGIFDRESSES